MINQYAALHAGYIAGLFDHLRFSSELLRDRGRSPNKIKAASLLAVHSLVHPVMNWKYPLVGAAVYLLEPSHMTTFALAILSTPWYAQGIVALAGMFAITLLAKAEDKYITNGLLARNALGKIQNAAWDGYEDGMGVKFYPKLTARNLPKVSIPG